jgi:TolB-like protein/Tfp pilus assembly protein PilF
MTDPIRFGRAELRASERQLLVDGCPVALGARAFDVLSLLIEHRDRVVTKDELLQVVWPGLVVEENNLQVQISNLRKCLGAGAITTIPGRGYRFTLTVASGRSDVCTGAKTETAIDRSIAVLPFVDMSETKDQEYFSDGLSEELIAMLTKVPGLRVPARTSSFYFKGKQSTVAEIAKALRVAYVLEGSVRKAGNRLRITAQLIRVDNGYHLWSESYDRDLDDLFKVQDEIASAVVNALKISLLAGTLSDANRAPNTDAYTLYLQARAISRRGTKPDRDKAAEYLQQALQHDPDFAPAWAEFSKNRISQLQRRLLPTRQAADEARHAAERAIALDPGLCAAHVAMARIHFFVAWDWMLADAEIRRAREFDPSDGDALRWAGIIAETMGRLDEAVELFRQAVDQDPLTGANYAKLGETLFYIGRLSEARAANLTALDLVPTDGPTHSALGMLLLAEGQPEAALAEFEHDPREDAREAGRALAYHALGRRADADAALAGLRKRHGIDGAFTVAEIYSYWGDADLAFDALDDAYEQRDWQLHVIKVDPLFDNLRRDPRYKAFLRKMRLPE